MIIRLALSLLICAFIVLAIADLLTCFAVPFLPDFIIQLGLGLLFCAFILLLMLCLFTIGKHILQAILSYFSATQRGQRRVLFIQNKQAELKQYFHHRTLRINYLHELTRQQLLHRNNHQHLIALSKAIEQDLKALKNSVPKATLKQLQQEHRRYRQQQDSEALVQLQQKIRHDY
jgi:hypothetical protein